MENYFNYFTEIEEHFQKRRGTVLLLSTLDWALIESWKEAGIPLEAVLRGIDAAFDRYDRRPSKTRKVNSLAFCAQEVLAAAEEMKEAAVGIARPEVESAGFEPARVAAFLKANAAALEGAALPDSVRPAAQEVARTLRELAAGFDEAGRSTALEDLERRLTVLEDKLFAVLLAATPDDEVMATRAQAERDLAPYRRKMSGPQIEQLQRQYMHKRLLDRHKLPRLSLFYLT
ncbi:MAG TPA: hypothetical protein VNK82_13155 [Terriglobales bacterium]|nr:hypothetical protein [Terriglobales bacterium]